MSNYIELRVAKGTAIFIFFNILSDLLIVKKLPSPAARATHFNTSAATAVCMPQQDLTAWWGTVASSGARPADSWEELQLLLPWTPQQAQA